MKKHLLLLLGVLMALPALTQAQDFSYEYEGQTLNYSIRSWEDRTVGVGNNQSVTGDVKIPETVTYEGTEFTVVNINGGAFSHATGMTSIELPNTIVLIEAYAFSECSSLQSFFMPASVKTIEWNVFGGCYGLNKAEFESIESLCSINISTSDSNPLAFAQHLYINGEEVFDVVIPESVTSIGSNAFNGGAYLRSIKIPDSVTSIGENAFAEMKNLISVELPNSLKEIKNYSFSNCNSLQSIALPPSLTVIGERAFDYCTSLTSVEIPQSVTQIGSHAFEGCSNIQSINIPDNITIIHPFTFSGCNSLKSIVIPNSVTMIGGRAFQGLHSLTSIRIPESVTSIGEYAFTECSHLESIIIPKNVKTLSNGALSYCDNLSKVIINNPEVQLGSNILDRYTWDAKEALFFCPDVLDISSLNLEEYKFDVVRFDPDKAEILDDGTILGDDGRTLLSAGVTNGSYVIPDGVATITRNAFKSAGFIESLTIPASVEVVEEDAFKGEDADISGSSPIGRVNFADWPKWYENVELGNIFSNPYRKCGAYAGGVRISVPEFEEGLNEIKDFILCGLEFEVSDLKLPNTLTHIGDYAFYNSKNLASVVIPASVTYIGEKAFGDCKNLGFVVVSNPETQIAQDAFSNPSWDPWEEKNSHFYCPDGLDLSGLDLSSYIVDRFDPENTTILADGTQLDKEGKVLVKAAVKSEDYVIPDGIVTIAGNAFANVYELRALTIPASVEVVEADAFRNISIDRVNFEDWDNWYENVRLGNLFANPYRDNGQAYFAGKKISRIELREGMDRIPDYVNYGIDFKFEAELELPSTIKRIGAYAFYNNKELCNVIMPEGLEGIGESAFEGCDLLESPVFPSSLRTIGHSAFADCKSITEIELPEGLSQLGIKEEWESDGAYSIFKGVFENCSSIEKAVVVCEIENLSDRLFSNCTSLNKVYLPLQLKSVGPMTFLNCYSLEDITFPSSLETISYQAFANISGNKGSLTNLVIPNNVKHIGDQAFLNQSLTRLTIGSGVEEIQGSTFAGNCLRVLELSEGIRKIESSAFADNTHADGISLVQLPSTLTYLGRGAFENTLITELVIPDGITELGSGSCGLPSILTVGSGVKNMDNDAFDFAYLKVLRMKANTPPSLNEAFKISEEQNDALTLIVNNGRKDKFTTNARWKQIDNIIEEGSADVVIYMTGDYALSEEIRTTTGIMPSQVTKMKVVGPLTQNDLRIIKENMVSLQSLDMSEVTGVTSIPESQFENSLLSEISLPTNTEKIGNNAFANCSLLKFTELPESVKFIGSYAFANCPGLSISRLPESLEGIGSNAFENCTGIRELTSGSKLGEYREDDYDMDGGIGEYAFTGCTLLEKVDLSSSQLYDLSDGVFSGCRELDEVLLPESLQIIGSDAFQGTAIRDIAFASAVKQIGWGAFRNCRRLVAANLPENLENVEESLFENCLRLLAVSMPSATKNVARNIVYGDKKLSNISCAALNAPAAENGTFNNIRQRYVSLTVPTLSYRSYLNAPQWGKFESIQNRIPVTIDPGVEVTNVAEDEYQDMLKEDALEDAQALAAEEKADEPSPVVLRRVARRAAARTATGRSFAKLFDGAQIQTGSEGKGTRVFINPEEGVTVTSVLYNGKEIIQDLEGNSLLLPAGSNGSLVIRTNSVVTTVGEINTGIAEGPVEVYDLQGLKVADSLDGLAKGMYIVRQGGSVKKIAVK